MGQENDVNGYLHSAVLQLILPVSPGRTVRQTEWSSILVITDQRALPPPFCSISKAACRGSVTFDPVGEEWLLWQLLPHGWGRLFALDVLSYLGPPRLASSELVKRRRVPD